jgi:glycosyltransferase involved in cell wall biosynthesis
MQILFLFESPLPTAYHSGTLAPGELRVIASVSSVAHVHAIGRNGVPLYDTQLHNKQTTAEKKISLQRVPFTSSQLAYYLSPIWLLISGWWYIKHHPVDVIQAESPILSGLAAVTLSKLTGIPAIVELRSSFLEFTDQRFSLLPKFVKHWLVRRLYQYSFSGSRYIMGNSSYYQRYLKSLGYDQVSHYNPGVRIPKSYKQSKTSNQTITLGFLGRLYRDKGAEYLIRAVAVLVEPDRAGVKPKHVEQDPLTTPSPSLQKEGNIIRVLIAGDGPERGRLEQLTRELDLSDVITFLGTQDRWQFLKQIDIFVNPCIVRPALEMNNAEAAAAGIPIVGFGDVDRPVTLRNNLNGLTVPNQDIEKLAQAISTLINHPQLRKKFGQAGKKLYQQKFSFQQQVKQLEKVYNKVGKQNNMLFP